MLLTAGWGIAGAGSSVGEGVEVTLECPGLREGEGWTPLQRQAVGEATGAKVRVGLASVPPCPLRPFLPALPLVPTKPSAHRNARPGSPVLPAPGKATAARLASGRKRGAHRKGVGEEGRGPGEMFGLPVCLDAKISGLQVRGPRLTLLS